MHFGNKTSDFFRILKPGLVTAPILALLNYKVITHNHLPKEAKPSVWLKIFSIFGIVFLALFSIVFITWRFFL